jgi:purine-nucleoside phosphorylase
MTPDQTPAPPSQLAQEAATWIAAECQRRAGRVIAPQVGIILGSGLNAVLADAAPVARFAYSEIPHFAAPTVSGHAGQFELAMLGATPVAILRGRYHPYEGHPAALVVLPVRTLHALGVQTLIVTNAAGGLNPGFKQGDLMLMRDHIGLPTLAGMNPLIGPNDEALGPRFPAMGAAYDPELLDLTRAVALRKHLHLQEGVYIMVAGPTYETPAEMHALRVLGADAVGMSTVPEVIAARHMQMRVLGISCITNSATPETAEAVNHNEVLDGAKQTMPKLDLLLHSVLHALALKEKGQLPFADAAQPTLAALPDVAANSHVTAAATPDAAPDASTAKRKALTFRTDPLG